MDGAGAAMSGTPRSTMTELVRVAVSAPADESGVVLAERLSDAADHRTRLLIDGFVHENGPAPTRFAWIALGSHARRELHCASDQDHALLWADDRAAASSYAADLAATVIAGLVEFGMRECSGGYMADTWSRSVADWTAMLADHIEAPTPQAVLDTDIFLDMRHLAGDLDTTAQAQMLLTGADSTRLLHGLAVAANSFPVPLSAFGRLPRGSIDLKKGGLAAAVLLARLYGLRAQSADVATIQRYLAAQSGGILGPEITDRLVTAFQFLVALRLRHQKDQIESGDPLSDLVMVDQLTASDQERLRLALRSIKEAQSVTALTFRTDL